MKIVHTPSDVLHLVASPITKIDKKMGILIDDMIATLLRQKDPEGVGLAAPQVGVSKQLFITLSNPDKGPIVYINPKIVTVKYQKVKIKKMDKKKSSSAKAPTVAKALAGKSEGKSSKLESKNVPLEGCLSIPKIWGEVKRPDKVKLRWTDREEKKHTEWIVGFEATIVQHEMDHLNGVLFTSHVIDQNNQLYKEDKGELHEFEI